MRIAPRGLVGVGDESCSERCSTVSASYWSCKPEETLTLQDMRLAAYAGLIGGAKGILWYHWGVLPYAWTRDGEGDRIRIDVNPEVHARLVDELKSLVAELKAVGPIVTDGQPVRDAVIDWFASDGSDVGPQMYRVWDYGGKRYLMGINLSDAPVQGQVFGANTGLNANAFSATAFLDDGGMSPLEDDGRGGAHFVIGGRGAGVLELTRIPIAPDPEK